MHTVIKTFFKIKTADTNCHLSDWQKSNKLRIHPVGAAVEEEELTHIRCDRVKWYSPIGKAIWQHLTKLRETL